MDGRQSILDMDFIEAKNFFMKSSSYFSGDLPHYFDFQPLLDHVFDLLGNSSLNDIMHSDIKVWNCEKVNHVILTNKDGKLSWRPLELIHPILYSFLVKEITTDENWNKLKARFSEFQSNTKIVCLSIPVKSLSEKKDRAEQVTNWWEKFELNSLEMAIDYDLMFVTDIADCYNSIYTHSIAWAVETKEIAKQSRKEKLLGNNLDSYIQKMRYGQTNGIPQGSVVMDFIAELLLGYIDKELSQRITDIEDYKILRYRDDYRIFVNNSRDGEKILKILSECLSEVGLKLNSSKTIGSSDIIVDSIKKDKLSLLTKRNKDGFLLKQALIIKSHSLDYPNSGSLLGLLGKFSKRIFHIESLDITYSAIISIITDLAVKNPKVQPVCFAIVSKILTLMEDADRLVLIKRLKAKFEKLPNIGYLEVWFQRAIKDYDDSIEFNESLCKLVKDTSVRIWDSSWVGSRELSNIMDSIAILDLESYREIDPIIKLGEFDLFSPY